MAKAVPSWTSRTRPLIETRPGSDPIHPEACITELTSGLCLVRQGTGTVKGRPRRSRRLGGSKLLTFGSISHPTEERNSQATRAIVQILPIIPCPNNLCCSSTMLMVRPMIPRPPTPKSSRALVDLTPGVRFSEKQCRIGLSEHIDSAELHVDSVSEISLSSTTRDPN